MAVNDPLSIRSSADDLLERLEEPTVVAALNTLLDHADLLAIVVVALDGFLSRGDVIANTLAEAVGEFRGATIPGGALAGIDVKALASTVGSLTPPLVAATPALATVLTKVSQPQTVELVTQLTNAVAEARDSAPNSNPPTGLFALMRTLKDPDVARGIDFFVQLAKSFGKQRAS